MFDFSFMTSLPGRRLTECLSVFRLPVCPIEQRQKCIYANWNILRCDQSMPYFFL